MSMYRCSQRRTTTQFSTWKHKLFFFWIAVIFSLQCSMAEKRMQPCYLTKTLRQPLATLPSIHTNAVLPQRSRKEKKEHHQEKKKKYICVNQTAVHHVDLSSSFLVEKKCTDLDNWPKTQSSHFLTVASIHWFNHEKRGDDVPNFQRTNKSLLIPKPVGSCHVI